MTQREVATIALKAGEILLLNGAETFRIEETVSRICASYGCCGECVSLPYGLFLTIGEDKETQTTIMRKVNGEQFDLHKIELVNDFSRSLNKKTLEYDEAITKLNEIKKAPNFSILVQSFAACVTGSVYTIFFNGSVYDAIAAAIICFVVFFVTNKIKFSGIMQYVIQSVAGFLIGILSILAMVSFPSLNSHIINTGSIMILVPGIVLTNGFKDFVFGDFSSGMAKIFESILIVGAVAIGVGIALMIGAERFGVT